MPPVSLSEIVHARERLEGIAVTTPLLSFGGPVPDDNALWLKAESLQRTGSFKFRGAYNAVSALSPEEQGRGVITYSSGNHGQAVACAARLLGIPAVVVMPEDAIPVKVALTQRWGAAIEFAGLTSLDRQERAFALVKEHGYTVIPPFDDRRIIAGQGTVALEILDQQPDLEAVVVPVGGGGLISGIATAIKAHRPDVRVVGAEPEGGADAKASLETGKLVTLGHVETVADGLRTSRIGELNFATMQECVDEVVTVPDEETLRAVGILAAEARLVVEPSGAVSTAAVLFGHTGLHARKAVAVISGGNVDPARLRACLAEPVLAAT
jgi:threonine dehydratase